MPAALATSRSSRSNGKQTRTISTTSRCEINALSGNHQPDNSECVPEAVLPRRSARLACTYKYTVPANKSIVPNMRLLEREGLTRSLDRYKPVKQKDLSKQPAWPKFESHRSSAHGNRKLQREYSFVLVDCGTHFEMVSPKAVGHFSRVPQCFGTMAPYHIFGADIGEEELRKKLQADRVVKKNEDSDKNASAQNSVGTNQKRKRDRSENAVQRPVKKVKVTSTRK